MDLIDREHLISVMCNHCTAQERCKANNEESECDDVDILIIRNAPRVEAIAWIPVKWRELTDEEREYYGDDYTCMADCKLPDDGDQILISRNNGLWVSLVEFCNDDYVTDSDGNDWVNDVDAWMPLPKGYIKQSETIAQEQDVT